MLEKGIFICIEGLDGCGKTTQTALLVQRLKGCGHAVHSTSEPSLGEIGQFIHQYCLHRSTRISSVVEALLFAADRYEHVEGEVLPAIDEGKIVVSDRYIYSSLAYQGAEGVDLWWIKEINKHIPPPDLAIFLDVKPEIVIQRLKKRRSVMEKLITQNKVLKIYQKFVEQGELVKINGNKSRGEVADDIFELVQHFLAKTSRVSSTLS
jgi:dTMP kinase